MKDDPLLFDYNVQERVDDFVAAALSQVVLSAWWFHTFFISSLTYFWSSLG